MKEILHQQMFESGSYQSQPEHVALYKALEASMDRDNKGEFFKETTKSRKRHRDDQDPPPDLDCVECSFKLFKPIGLALQSEQPIEDIPIPDDHAPEEERPKTPEPDWAVPLNDLREPENNLANAIAKSYKDPKENKLLRRIGDIGSFIKWYCRQIGKLKLGKGDLEGPANKIDLVNPEGNQIVHDVSKPLPLGGPPDQVIIQPQYFFSKDLEYLISGDKDRRHALSISKPKAASYQDFGLEELVPSLHNAHSGCRAVRSHMKILSVTSGYSSTIPGMENRIWFEDDKRRSKKFMEVIERRLKIRRIFSNLKSFCKLGDFDVHTLEDPTLILEILSRRFFLRLNLPDHRSVLTGSRGSSRWRWRYLIPV
ncbi:hypothetical protein Tco_0699265 [Tanacetum coccineum]